MYARFLSPEMKDRGLLCDSETWVLCFVRLAEGAPEKGDPEEEEL